MIPVQVFSYGLKCIAILLCKHILTTLEQQNPQAILFFSAPRAQSGLTSWPCHGWSFHPTSSRWPLHLPGASKNTVEPEATYELALLARIKKIWRCSWIHFHRLLFMHVYIHIDIYILYSNVTISTHTYVYIYIYINNYKYISTAAWNAACSEIWEQKRRRKCQIIGRKASKKFQVLLYLQLTSLHIIRL